MLRRYIHKQGSTLTSCIYEGDIPPQILRCLDDPKLSARLEEAAVGIRPHGWSSGSTLNLPPAGALKD